MGCLTTWELVASTVRVKAIKMIIIYNLEVWCKKKHKQHIYPSISIRSSNQMNVCWHWKKWIKSQHKIKRIVLTDFKPEKDPKSFMWDKNAHVLKRASYWLIRCHTMIALCHIIILVSCVNIFVKLLFPVSHSQW